MTLLIKALSGALVTVLIAWIGILTWHAHSIQSYKNRTGVAGLVAEAGGWNYLLQLPMVLFLLTAAFGIGLFFTVWFVTRH